MERLLLLAVLAIAALLRLWNLDQNGWGADYYSAAARSMSLGWSNLLFCAFDPAGFISVDKPPVALWMQVAGVKLLGYRPMGLLLPQVLEGLGCVVLVHVLVRRSFGVAAGLLAALLFATTPVMVAVNRTNNMDSCLLVVLLLAAWALLRAAESGRRALLLAAMALVGVAFNTKMLAGYIVLPTFVVVYLLGAPVDLRRRIADLALGALVLVAASLSWPLVVELTPVEKRPYVGGSLTNSVFELAIGHNAKSRFTLADRPGAAVPRPARPQSQSAPDPDEARPGIVAQRLFVREPAGVFRLAGGQLAAQASWFVPIAAMALALLARGIRLPLAPAHQSLLFWLCWAGTYLVVYSALGGIFHYYYLSTLAPAFAALAGIGAMHLWTEYLQGRPKAYLLPATLVAAALWQLHVQASALGWGLDSLATRGGWQGALVLVTLIGTGIGVAGLVAIRMRGDVARRPALGFVGLAFAALLAMPLAWSLSSVLVPGNGILPSADLYRLDPSVMRSDDPRVRGAFGRLADTDSLVELLRANRSGERYLVATSTTRFAAPIIVATGEAVMAMGGYHGLDPAVTPEELEWLVADGQVRFAMLGDAGPASRRLGADAALEPLAAWIRAHGRRIPIARWRPATFPRGVALYDLRADIALK